MSLVIRPYQDEDAPAMAQVFFDSVRQLGARFYSAEQTAAWAPKPPDPVLVRSRARDGRWVLVAEDPPGELVGYGELERDGHIDHLYRRPDAPGVGSALLERLVALAREQGLRRLYVEASEGARPLFERQGFTLIERRAFLLRGRRIHHYLMERALRRRAGEP